MSRKFKRLTVSTLALLVFAVASQPFSAAAEDQDDKTLQRWDCVVNETPHTVDVSIVMHDGCICKKTLAPHEELIFKVSRHRHTAVLAAYKHGTRKLVTLEPFGTKPRLKPFVDCLHFDEGICTHTAVIRDEDKADE